MADPKPPTRAQLAKFLPDESAIKAFERVFQMAGDITPAELQELAYLANTLKSRISGETQKMAEMEEMQPRIVNLSNIESRLHELEVQIARRPSYDALMRRIEDLEKLVGV